MSDQSIEQPLEAGSVIELDPFKFQSFMKQVENSQDLSLGILGGVAAALIGATIWALITIATGFQISWMAVGVGFLVGLAVSKFGKGVDRIFGIVGAVLSLLGCLTGNLLTIAIVISGEEAVSLFEVFLFFVTVPEAVIELMKVTFSPIDLLFYGIAIFAGYNYSFKQVAELATLSKDLKL